MLAIILFSVYLAPLKAVEIQQSLQQNVKGPMTYLPPAPYLPPVLSPLISPSYVTKTGHTAYQVPVESENCPNSEVLQNILSLLIRLLNEDNISQIGEPNEMQLQILALLKNYRQFKESQNGDNVKQNKIEKVPIFNLPNEENLRSPLKAEFVLKYDISNRSCKDAINVLIQTLYNIYSRLNLMCEQTGKCSFQPHLQELPSIFKDLSLTPPKDLYLNNISNEIPYFSDTQNQISTYQAFPDINFHLNHAPYANNFQLNNIPSHGKENVYQDNINDYNKLLEEFMKINKVENKDSERNEFLTEQLYAKESNKKHRPTIPYVSNLAMNNVPKKLLSFNEFVKGFQDRNIKLADYASTNANEYKQINLNNHLSPPFKQHIFLDTQAPNSKLFTAPENWLQLNQSPEIEIYSKKPIFSNIGSSQIKMSKLLTPNIQEMLVKPLHVNHQDIQIINHESDVNYKRHPIHSMNPLAPSYFPDYLRQDAYGSKLLDSQHLASVHNLVKLNLASDNNGIVELTYMLTKPRPSLNKRYYYVKYRLPYRAFQNSNLKSNPLRLSEELLSASNLAEVSPDLRNVGNDELTKLIKEGGVLVDAKVLPANHSKTDRYLKTIQKLNGNLNTNEILNLVQNGNKRKNDITNLKSHKLNENELSSKIYFDPSLSRLFSSSPYLANVNRNSLPNSLPNPMEMNSINFAALPTNNINPRVKYDKAINLQSFAPNSLMRATEDPKTLFGR